MECSLRTGLEVWRLTGLYCAAQEITVKVFHVGQRWFIPVPLVGSPPLFILFCNFSFFLSFFGMLIIIYIYMCAPVVAVYLKINTKVDHRRA